MGENEAHRRILIEMQYTVRNIPIIDTVVRRACVQKGNDGGYVP